MMIRFLQTTPSENPDFPFQPGQVITVASPSDFLLAALRDGLAEAIPEDVIERAIAPEEERPEPVRTKGRRAARV